MPNLDLTVLVHDGPQARAYLSYMKQRGYSPANLIVMVNDYNKHKSKSIATWLPYSFRLKFLRSLQQNQNNYWVKFLSAKHPVFVDTIAKKLQKELGVPSCLFDDIKQTKPFHEYCSDIDYILCNGLADSRLEEQIIKKSKQYILYTGGGLVRKNLLSLKNKKIIHIHPGILPEVKGADGFLWSLMTRDAPGMSSFFMDIKIDTGDLICKSEYQKISFPANSSINTDMLYRALFSFIDPIYRADFLVNHLFPSTNNLKTIETKPQESGGMDYHFLQKNLKAAALKLLFTNLSR